MVDYIQVGLGLGIMSLGGYIAYSNYKGLQRIYDKAAVMIIEDPTIIERWPKKMVNGARKRNIEADLVVIEYELRCKK